MTLELEITILDFEFFFKIYIINTGDGLLVNRCDEHSPRLMLQISIWHPSFLVVGMWSIDGRATRPRHIDSSYFSRANRHFRVSAIFLKKFQKCSRSFSVLFGKSGDSHDTCLLCPGSIC